MPSELIDAEVTHIAWDHNIYLTLTIAVEEHALPAPLPEASAEVVADDTLTADVNADPAAIAEILGEPHSDEVGFMLVDASRAHRLPVTQLESNLYQARINVTNFRNRSQVPNGSWRVVPFKDGIRHPDAKFDLHRVDELEANSKTFIYNGNKSSYTFNFDISEHDTRPEFIMRAYQFGRSGKKNGRKGVRKHVAKLRPKAIARKALSKKNVVKAQNRYYKTFRRRHEPKGNHIVFASEARDSLAGNLIAIRDKLIERGLDKQFKISYSITKPGTLTRRGRLQQIKLLASADFVILDDYFPLLEQVKLDPRTTVIQAWHAGSGFKAIGYSRFGRYGSPRLANAHRQYTYAITGSKHLTHVYSEAFGIEENAVVPTGLPRIDKFLDIEGQAEARRKFTEAYRGLDGKRKILFAPTFRGRGMNTAYYDYSQIDFDALYEMCGEDSVVLFRMHHFVKEPVPIREEHKDRFFDLTHYPDGLGLLHSTDVLITDYSSIIYEFALLNKPMVFFAYDKDVYSATRGFHRDFDETAPGTICTTFESLVHTLATEDYDLDRIAKFRAENFDRIDTNSADRFIDWLILGDRPQEDE